mmetsp:Transcript_33684/g.95292  ORF Transcript_33684/g.95292 Transcript_33684/m.95292 type:complete len:99 (-) Transcript_33684:140-436(-)
MAMDLIMENAFKPSDYVLPFTLNVYSVQTTLSDSVTGECGDKGMVNETSPPDSPGLYATLVRMEDVEVLSSAAGLASPSTLLGILLAGATTVALCIAA